MMVSLEQHVFRGVMGGEEVHSLKHLYPLKLSRAPDGPPVVVEGEAPVVVEGEESSGSPPIAEEQDWLCPQRNLPQQNQNMIGCDSCNKWYHFRCVGIDSEPPSR